MEKFKFIKYLDIDFCERTAIIETQNKSIITVYFKEYNNFDGNIDDLIFNEGDIFEAELGIIWITKPKIVSNQEKQYIQNIDKSSHIEATIKVEKIIDEYQVLASSNIIEENIILDFEVNYNIQENDLLSVSGSLSIQNEAKDFGF